MVVVERIKGVEEFFLALFAFAEKLDVVDDEDVDGSELALELGQCTLFDCADETIDEFFTAQEAYDSGREFVSCFVSDTMEQMSFSESDTAVEKQRVVCAARCVADGDAACVGEPVAWADDKTFESIVGV